MTALRDAVILMAGSGSRLRRSQDDFPKQLATILGRPLIGYILDTLVHAGISKALIVVGYEKNRLTDAVIRLAPPSLALSFIENPDWRKQNGVSLLAAAKCIHSDFLLTMSDHVFDQSIVDLMAESPRRGILNVAIDRKLDAIFDLHDAMKIETRGEGIRAIGKDLQHYDAVDTGLFACPVEIFDYLERAKKDGDCSLADGVRLMAADNKVRVVDIGRGWWQDIDTPEMLACAEKHLRMRIRPDDFGAETSSGPQARHGCHSQDDTCDHDPEVENPLWETRQREQNKK
jgi:1L-myo-inositol 1-phosphate cytidylyltransferase